MTCVKCGAWAPEDPNTGADGDGICPRCEADGYELTDAGEIVNTHEPPVIPVDDFEQTRR